MMQSGNRVTMAKVTNVQVFDKLGRSRRRRGYRR